MSRFLDHFDATQAFYGAVLSILVYTVGTLLLGGGTIGELSATDTDNLGGLILATIPGLLAYWLYDLTHALKTSLDEWSDAWRIVILFQIGFAALFAINAMQPLNYFPAVEEYAGAAGLRKYVALVWDAGALLLLSDVLGEMWHEYVSDNDLLEVEG